MHQTLPQRFSVLRKRGLPARDALHRARALTQPVYATEPFIGSHFPFDRNSRNESDVCRFRWVEHVTFLGWRRAGYADDIRSSMRHRGWFADTHQHEVYRGIVYRLPGVRFVFGYADPVNSDCALIANATTQDIDDAARRADQIAERFAERDRDYDEAWHAVSNAIESRRSARAIVSDTLANLRELETCDSPRIRDAILSAFNHAWTAYRSASSSLRDVIAQTAEFNISAAEF